MKIYWYPVLDDYMFEFNGKIYQNWYGLWHGGFNRSKHFKLVVEL